MGKMGNVKNCKNIGKTSREIERERERERNYINVIDLQPFSWSVVGCVLRVDCH